MRSRPAEDRVTELTRRRLAALAAELAAARGDAVPPPAPAPVPVPEETPGEAAAEETAGRPARGLTSGRHARRAPHLRSRFTGWVGDRVPPALANRPHLGSAQTGLVLVIVAAGLVLSAWWLLRAGGSGEGGAAPARPSVSAITSPSAPIATPGAGVSAGAGQAAGGSPSGGSAPGTQASPAAGADQIVVDVAGKVRHPGIAVLPAGARVVDAVRAAGGVKPGVDRSTVNLARLLTDGEQVLIGVGPTGPAPAGASPAPAGSAGAGPGALVDVNTADQAALETLPGVGPVTAQAILQWRTEHGAFTSVDELLEVSGIGDATLAKIAPYVTL